MFAGFNTNHSVLQFQLEYPFMWHINSASYWSTNVLGCASKPWEKNTETKTISLYTIMYSINT